MTTFTAPALFLGDPQISGPLTIHPILSDEEPGLPYRGLANGLDHGVAVTEVDEEGSVNDVLVRNGSDLPVLLYEGELILGARQNRTVDAPVLIPPRVKVAVPVSCIEHGRWDGGRRAEHFTSAPYAVDPELRGAKRRQANERASRGGEARPDQGEVWSTVSDRLNAHLVASPSSALSDLYEQRRDPLEELLSGVRLLDGQVGAVVELLGRPVALDLVSRPEVFAELLPRLAQGYALQALGLPIAPPKPPRLDGRAFFEKAISSRHRWLPTPGMGDAFKLTRRTVHGCGLRAEGEIIALSAFPTSANR